MSTIWLVPPYYTPPPPVYVMTPGVGNYPASRQPTAETMMQVLTAGDLGWPVGFMTGAAGMGSLKPTEFIKAVVDYAFSLTESQYAEFTCVDFDPVVRGTHYANLIIDTLKQIAANNWAQNTEGSVFDYWASGKVLA